MIKTAKKFKISIENAGERLDKFLADQLKELSRSHIQKMINEGQVMLNGKIPTAHYKVKENDLVQIKSDKVEVEAVKKEAVKTILPKLAIISDTDDYLVINKPAGLIVHGAAHIKAATLVDALLKKYPKVKKVGEDPDRPGIVHRLDKDVSGIMVIAKTQDSFDNLKKQFQERSMDKQYLGLVYGKIAKEQDIINFPIERSASGHKMAAKPIINRGELNKEGKTAITEIFVEQKLINYTLLRINIKTGRTHQIRAHMAAYGHPIVGDPIYSTARTRIENKKLNLQRVFLVAYKLEFTDLAGKRQQFEIGLPEDLKNILKKLK